MGQVTSEGGQVKRTKAGLERARRQGKRIGRPRVSVDMAKAVALRGEGKRIREESMQQAVERARELEQMSAQLSHELKNPLGAIKTFVQLSCRHATDPDSREQLQLAEGEVERMNTILQGYLSFSRPLDKLRPQPVEVESLADEVLQLLDARARAAGVTLRRRGQARLEADPRRLREALFNLIANGLEATPAGGEVEVEITQTSASSTIHVRDTGRGMPPEMLARLGTPFFTTRKKGTAWELPSPAPRSCSTAARWGGCPRL